MDKTCKACSKSFKLFNKDSELIKKFSLSLGSEQVSVPAPTLCPDCRAQRRLAWRNERRYFRSRSSLSGKALISVFPPDREIKSYSFDEWWSDSYDPLKYGRDFDFNRTFMEQFRELLVAVPHMAMIGSQNENSSFCHLIANCRNCYLLIESSNCEDCYYSYWLQKCLCCVDSCFSHECQYCYEIDNCYNCYNLNYSKDCNNCSDSSFLQSCTGCTYCFGCANLQHKEFHIYNKPVSKAEYLKFISNTNLGSRSSVAQTQVKFTDFLKNFPRKYAQISKSTDCSGNYIISSKDCFNCYHAHDAEECRYGEHVWRNSRFNMDVSTVGRDAELVYESMNTGISSYRVMFSIQCWTCSEMSYCYCCMNSKQSFGCVGLKNNRFCIFNKEYSESDYYKLVAKIVDHMKASREFGEFFSAEASIFPYNESSAQEQFPLNSEQCRQKSLPWRIPDKKDYLPQTFKAPDDIQNTGQSIIENLLSCQSCRKNYKIISQELDFYRKYQMPVPVNCPDCRHFKRMQARPAAKLSEVNCDSCKQVIDSPYSKNGSSGIYCESCFAKALI